LLIARIVVVAGSVVIVIVVVVARIVVARIVARAPTIANYAAVIGGDPISATSPWNPAGIISLTPGIAIAVSIAAIAIIIAHVIWIHGQPPAAPPTVSVVPAWIAVAHIRGG